MTDPADIADKLLRLADLVANGLLERDEYDLLKADLLAQTTGAATPGSGASSTDASPPAGPPAADEPPPPAAPGRTELEQIAEELRATLNRMPDSALVATLANNRWAYLVKFPTTASSFTRRVELVDGSETVVLMRSRRDDLWEITARRFTDGAMPPPAAAERRSGPPPV